MKTNPNPAYRVGEQVEMTINARIIGVHELADGAGELLELEYLHGGEAMNTALPADAESITTKRVGTCGHRVATSEWRVGFRECERCPTAAEDETPAGGESR